MPWSERKRLILEGKVPDAGPLLVFMYKHPVWFVLVGLGAIGALLAGCLACILM